VTPLQRSGSTRNGVSWVDRGRLSDTYRGAKGLEGFLGRAEGRSRPELNDLAQCAADLAVGVAGVDFSGVALFAASGDATMIGASGHRSRVWSQLVIGTTDPFAGRVIDLGYVVFADCVRHSQLLRVAVTEESAFGLLAVRIKQRGLSLGVIYGGVRHADHAIARELSTLRQVARLCAGAFSSTMIIRPYRPSTGSSETLSPREREVLQLLSEGLSTRAVAATAHLSHNTVRSYVQTALSKLGAHNRLHAVAIAREAGLIGMSSRIPV
jgi:DNA-binding CsgD family transcriptional regulator